MHIQESVLDEDGKINPHKIDLMGRMGARLLRTCQRRSYS